jgi:hypothetical protein
MAVEIAKRYCDEKDTAEQRGGQINGLPDSGYDAGEKRYDLAVPWQTP